MTHRATHNQNSDKETGATTGDKLEDCLKDKPFQLVKPLAVTMSIFGLLFFNRKNSRRSMITKAYSVVNLFVMGACTCHVFLLFGDTDGRNHITFKIVVYIWYAHCFVNALATYKACDHRFVEFLIKWSRLLKTNRGRSPDDPGLSYATYKSYLKRRLHLVLLLAWVLFIVNCVSEAYLIYGTDLVDFTIAPFQPTDRFASLLKGVVELTNVYFSAAWIFPLAMFVMISEVIYKEFEIFHNDLRKAISAEGDMADLEWFRQRHQSICQMVEAADDILSASNAGGILCSAIDAMLMLYSLLSNPGVKSDSVLFGGYVFWIGVTSIYIFVVSYGGGYLTHMAHAPLKTIHWIKIKHGSPEFTLQMNLFLSKLTGESIGLTALDMFVIDKPTILTIAGAFISYFIVLVQFPQPGAGPGHGASVCNCTSSIAGT